MRKGKSFWLQGRKKSEPRRVVENEKAWKNLSYRGRLCATLALAWLSDGSGYLVWVGWAS